MLVATVGVVAPWCSGIGAMRLIGRRLQHRAVRRRRADRDQRRHHRPRVRRPPGARDDRGAHRARRGRGRRRDGPRRPHRRRTRSSPRAVSVASRRCGSSRVRRRLPRRRRRWSALRLAPPLFGCDRAQSPARPARSWPRVRLHAAFAELADVAKLAPIVGAFVAGLALGRSRSVRAHPPRARRRSATCSSRCSSSRSASTPTSRRSSTATVLRDAGDPPRRRRGREAASRRRAVRHARRQAARRPRHAAPRRGRPDLRHDRSARPACSATTSTPRCSSSCSPTTLVTPMLLRWRYQRLAARPSCPSQPDGSLGAGSGWFMDHDGQLSLRAGRRRSLRWSSRWRVRSGSAERRRAASSSTGSPTSTGTSLGGRRAADTFLALLESGDARSWRFLDALDVLPPPRSPSSPTRSAIGETTRSCSIPPACTAGRRSSGSVNCWRHRAARGRSPKLRYPTSARLAAFLVDVLGNRDDRVPISAGTSSGWSSVRAREHEIATLVSDPVLLLHVARERNAFDEHSVFQLASALRRRRDRTCRVRPREPRSPTICSTGKRSASCTTLVETVLRARTGMPERRAWSTATDGDAARASDGSEAVLERIADARVTIVLLERPTATSARHAAMLARWRPRGRDRYLVSVGDADPPRPPDDGRRGHARSSRPARHTYARVLSDAGLDVDHAIVATWPDGSALESFLVTATEAPPSDVLHGAIEASRARRHWRPSRSSARGSTSTTPRRPGTRSVASRPTTSPGC